MSNDPASRTLVAWGRRGSCHVRLDRPASRRTGAARRLRGMNPRPRDFIGAAVLAIVLFALVAILVIGNIPAAEAG